MTNEIDLRGEFIDFHNPHKLSQLNEIVSLHTRLTPDVVMAATGCSFRQAMQILLLMFELYLAECFILIYLRDEPETFIGRRSLEEGLPSFPYEYDYGAKLVQYPEDILFSFEFVRKPDEDIEFVSRSK